MGFVLMGSFVTLYNYVGYRLIAAPFNLNQTEIGAIFVVYLTGVVASPWSGKMADAFGRGRVLIAALRADDRRRGADVVDVAAGGYRRIACVTFGFFAGHAVASGWVGLLAKGAKGQAAALYLLAYYIGSSVLGSWGGHFWTLDGWRGVTGLVFVLLLIGLVGAEILRRRERRVAA